MYICMYIHMYEKLLVGYICMPIHMYENFDTGQESIEVYPPLTILPYIMIPEDVKNKILNYFSGES